MAKAQRLTQKEYAARRGVTAQRINQLVKAGVIPVGPDGLIDVRQADRRIAHDKRRFRSNDSDRLLAARCEFEEARAGREALRLERERREHVRLDEVVQFLSEYVGLVRSFLGLLPSRVTSAVKVEDRAAVRAVVDREMRQLAATIQDELGRYWRGKLVEAQKEQK
jgi:hypothetical protein